MNKTAYDYIQKIEKLAALPTISFSEDKSKNSPAFPVSALYETSEKDRRKNPALGKQVKTYTMPYFLSDKQKEAMGELYEKIKKDPEKYNKAMPNVREFLSYKNGEPKEKDAFNLGYITTSGSRGNNGLVEYTTESPLDPVLVYKQDKESVEDYKNRIKKNVERGIKLSKGPKRSRNALIGAGIGALMGGATGGIAGRKLSRKGRIGAAAGSALLGSAAGALPAYYGSDAINEYRKRKNYRDLYNNLTNEERDVINRQLGETLLQHTKDRADQKVLKF